MTLSGSSSQAIYFSSADITLMHRDILTQRALWTLTIRSIARLSRSFQDEQADTVVDIQLHEQADARDATSARDFFARTAAVSVAAET